MTIIKNYPFKKEYSKVAKYKMKKRDKKLFIESIILTVIYLISFGILSLGRTQKTLFGISESTVSSLQLIILTFIFSMIITLVLYYLYKKALPWI